VNSPDTAVYYTFSTISQTLAGAIALLAAFVLYRLQSLNAEIHVSANHLRTFASGNTRHWMDIALLEGRDDKILTLAGAAEPGTFAGIGGEQIKASQTRLAAVRAHKGELSNRFWTALALTVPLVAFSVAVLSITPVLARPLQTIALAVGVVWSWACLASYVFVVKSALADAAQQ
jgi:hypothetical protein